VRRLESLPIADLLAWAALTLGLLAALVAVTFLWPPFKRVLLLFSVSVLLAYLLAPLVGWLRTHARRRGAVQPLPRLPAVLLAYVLAAVLGVAGWAAVTPWLRGVAFDVTTDTTRLLQATTGKVAGLDRRLLGLGLPPPAGDRLADAVLALTAQVADHAEVTLAEVAEHAPYFRWFGLAPLIAFVLLTEWSAFERSAVRVVPNAHLRWRAAEFLGHVNSTLAGYTRAQLLSCAFIGSACVVGFALIGVPYWFALGVVAGLLEFLPLVGPLAVAIVAASQLSGERLLALVLFLAVLRIVQDYVVYPRFVGRRMHLHPIAVVAAVIVGGSALGLAGVLCAVPLVGILAVTLRHYREYRDIQEAVRLYGREAGAPGADRGAPPRGTAADTGGGTAPPGPTQDVPDGATGTAGAAEAAGGTAPAGPAATGTP
jgi:predicted PurR-regulated permease PerM